MVVIVLALLAGACGRSNDDAQAPITPGTDTTIDEGTTIPDVGTTIPDVGTTVVRTVPPTVKPLPPTTKPKPTTTTRPLPKATLPKATTTTRAPTVTTQPLDVQKFCAYIASVDFNTLDNASWATAFGNLHDAVNNAEQMAPPSVKQALLDLKATLDAVQPAVDAGQISSTAQLDAWFVTLTSDVQQRISAATKQLQLYTMANCK